MKSMTRKLTVPLMALCLIVTIRTSLAMYDPNLQRWLNRDPLGDIGSLVYQTAALPLHDAADDTSEMGDGDFFDAWAQLNRNLYGGIANNPINLFDPFGLSPCHIWDIHDEKDPNQALAETNKRMNEQADAKNAKMIEDLNKVEREAVKAAAVAAVAEALGAEMAARAAVGKYLPKASEQLFGKAGWLNSNRYLRMGFSRDGGRKVFRIAGDWIGKFKKDPHIILKDCGPL